MSEELEQLLQQWGEEDDATSPLKELAPLKREVDLQNFHDSDLTAFPEVSSLFLGVNLEFRGIFK